MRRRGMLLMGLLGGSEPPMLTFTATTTGAETITLRRITPVGTAVTVDWGDGSTSTIANGEPGATSHAYAGAGTWTIRISDPQMLKHIYLDDVKIVFDTKALGVCGAALQYLSLHGLGDGSRIASADLKHLGLGSRLSIWAYRTGTYIFDSADVVGFATNEVMYLYFPLAGTYRFDSADLAACQAAQQLFLGFGDVGTYTFDSADITCVPSDTFYVDFPQPGTYTFDSADVAGLAVTFRLFVRFLVSGTYSIDTADFAACTPTYELSLQFPEAGTYVVDTADFAAVNPYTIALWFGTGAVVTTAQADWSGHPRLNNLIFRAGLSQAQVDAVLLGLYDGFATRTETGGEVHLNGEGNAVPSGDLQAACPPTTGKEAAYELVNDTCGVSSNHWLSVATA